RDSLGGRGDLPAPGDLPARRRRRHRIVPRPVDKGTIAAIATATGGGIGIIRLSGGRAEAIARAIVPSLPAALPTHRLVLGEAIDPHSKERLDQLLVVVMRGPHSFTGED